jgi:glycosyltransferase involved in cell wall biosynthesis
VTRIHVVSLPHTQLTKAYDWCAYTAKVRRFVGMLADAGHEAIVYGPDVHDVPKASEYVTVVNANDRLDWFPGETMGELSEWDTKNVFDHWDRDHISWRRMNARSAAEIRKRWQEHDVVGLIGGGCQAQIVEELGDLKPLVVEWGIGYSGTINGTHKVYESYAWAHHVAGFYRSDDVQHFDDVIPNCFDLDDFEFGATPGDYLLYMGRPNPRKGLPIIEEIAARTKLTVLIAGQPGPAIPNTEYVGLITGDVKKKLLAGARALLTPTTYLEPFGGVAVEAMLSGTPVISTDWGAFTETVVPGVTGFRCRMLRDFMEATEATADMDRARVRDHAESRYSTVVGSHMYGVYFERVEQLYHDGWYAGTDAFPRL